MRLDSELMRRVKAYALESERTLTAVIEDSLRETLARRQGRQPAGPIELATFRGDGLSPGIDLNDGRRLRDLMDGRDGDSV